ncbi:MAG: VTT domain-containing protein [Pirellulales bacterium]
MLRSLPRSFYVLIALTCIAIAIPLIPFLVYGERIDQAVEQWLDPPPSMVALATAEIGILAVDILLPVPSSMVTTLGGAQLGIVRGTICGWLGMTIGSILGWGLGSLVGGRAVKGLDSGTRESLEKRHQRLGPAVVVITRPLPLIAEVAAIMAGETGMSFLTFSVAAASSNLALAFAWSLTGRIGQQQGSLQWILVWSLVVPVALTWLWFHSRPSDSKIKP